MNQSKHASHVWRLAAASFILASLIGIKTVQAANIQVLTPQADFDPGSYPAGLVYGPDQSIWTTLSGTGKIGQVIGSTISTQGLPNAFSRPWDITLGSDQALWFSEEAADQIGRMDVDGNLSEYPLGEGKRSPTSVTLGQDMALWFTERDGNRIGRMTAKGELDEFNLPHANSKPMSIISAPNGDLWFTEWDNRLGKINLQGEISEYSIPGSLAQPVDLLAPQDGYIWLIFNSGKTIARFDPQQGTFTSHRLSTVSDSLADLTLGPDNRLWFVGTQTVGSFSLVDGAPANLTEEPLPHPVYSYQGRSQIITGPDNDLFFTTANTSTVYRSPLSGSPTLRDLQLFVTYRPPLLLAAGPFNIDVELVNWTNTEATNITIDLTLDESIHFVSSDLKTGGCVDGGLTVQCTVPSIGAGARLPVRFIMATDRVGTSPVSRTLVFDASSAEGDYQPANNRVVLFTTIQTSLDYFNNFSTGADSYWSHPVTSTPVSGLDVLGLFDNDQVSFNWEDLPPHDRIWLCFDLYIMGPWSGSQFVDEDETTVIGPDLWANSINEMYLQLTSFSNLARYQQAFPGNYPEALNPYKSAADQVGEFDGDSSVQDTRYRFCYRLVNSELSLDLLFMGLNLNELTREQWAIDNVRIKIYYDAAYVPLYLPTLLR